MKRSFLVTAFIFPLLLLIELEEDFIKWNESRKLNKDVGEYQFNKTTFQKDLDAIYKSVVDEKEKFQQQYDDESDYSRNKTKQEEWFKKIESELKQNKSWAGY